MMERSLPLEVTDEERNRNSSQAVCEGPSPRTLFTTGGDEGD